ncbi:tetratricopeptide repeat protein [Ktedonosporobacter rubrisoli]|uniref:Tetratricopeptide repeat protein n=1 Tax=Ktedonosporobacter rubrisoli TaxID=2509675 RepID=A0A4V0YY12_KTERU|nr:tetratricopeptide repeat protein [Ktedonosporobacter rubrisoli]QBD74611.1 tetratricopeptide repeat protein [Ktedonosporobacter rubrisoli]
MVENMQPHGTRNETERGEEQGPPYSYPAWLAEEEREDWFEECPPGLNGMAASDPVVRSMAMVEYMFNHPGQPDYGERVAQTYLEYGLSEGNEPGMALFWFGRAIAFLTTEQTAMRAQVHFSAGKAFNGMQRYTQALLALNEALRLTTESELAAMHIELYYQKGLALFSLGEHEQALEAFERALNMAIPQNMPHAGILLAKGNTLDMLERKEEALRTYTAVLEKSPEWALVFYERGVVFFNMQRYAQALPDFERALVLGFQRPLIFPRLAQSLYALGRESEARQFLEENLPRTSLCRLFTPEEILRLPVREIDVLIDYDQAIAGNYLSPGIIRRTMQGLNDLQRPKEAWKVLEEGFESWPQSSLLYWSKAELLEARQRYREALEAIEEADRLEPENEIILGTRARIVQRI